MFGPKTHCVVVVGAQWGDEGKGKIVDVLAERADLVVRYQGGANAGHTVHTAAGEFVLHQIPSGIIQGAICVVGNGVVLDPETLFTELDALSQRGIRTQHKLYVSERAHLTLPFHKLLDRAREAREKIGTTGRGIGPTYEDKYGRRGIRVGDLRNPERARELVCARVQAANRCCWRGRREPCSMSTTAPTPTSPRPTRRPAAPRSEPGSAPPPSTPCWASSRPTRRAWATDPCPPRRLHRSARRSGSWATSSGPPRDAHAAAAGSTPWWCATPCESTASPDSRSPSWTCSTRSPKSRYASSTSSLVTASPV